MCQIVRNMPDDDGFSIESHCIAKCIIESCFYKMFLPGLMNAIVKAWVAVKETTICKSFCKAGILDSTLNVVSCDLDDEDPFLAADESMALQGLIDDGCDRCEWRG